MVAIQPVGDYSEQGTPYSDRQRLGLARPQQDKSWDDADDEETTLLEMMAQMQKQMLAVKARWSQHQEKKKRLQKSEEDKAEISERSRPDINVRSGDIAGISGNPTLPPGKVGNYPMQGDDSLSGSPKDLEVPPQEASTSTTEERYSYSPDGGDDVKGKTQQVEYRSSTNIYKKGQQKFTFSKRDSTAPLTNHVKSEDVTSKSLNTFRAT